MGPNGAGKTTCFNVLTGRYKPDRGSVRFAGEDITGLSPRADRAQGASSRSFQIMNLFDDDTALDNVLIALPRGARAGLLDVARPRRATARRTTRPPRCSRASGWRARSTCRRKSLSYGERRALEIGVALAARAAPAVPRRADRGLGAEGTARLAELVAELKRQLTIVIIEHDMRFLFGLADRISVIHWGQVIAEGTPDALRRTRGCSARTWGLA